MWHPHRRVLSGCRVCLGDWSNMKDGRRLRRNRDGWEISILLNSQWLGVFDPLPPQYKTLGNESPLFVRSSRSYRFHQKDVSKTINSSTTNDGNPCVMTPNVSNSSNEFQYIQGSSVSPKLFSLPWIDTRYDRGKDFKLLPPTLNTYFYYNVYLCG